MVTRHSGQMTTGTILEVFPPTLLIIPRKEQYTFLGIIVSLPLLTCTLRCLYIVSTLTEELSVVYNPSSGRIGVIFTGKRQMMGDCLLCIG